MANPILVNLLKQSVEGWNNWRMKSSEESVDLYRAKLSYEDLNLANLIGANLIEAELICTNLHLANLIDTNLSCANLSGVNLNLADLIEANLEDANLEGANLSDANLSGANLKGANLSGANFINSIISDETKIFAKWRLVHELVNKGGQGRNLRDVDLSGADLHNVDLSGADLRGVDLSNANLKGADLMLCQAESTNFINADLTGVCIAGWSITSETKFKDIKCEFIYRGINSETAKLSDRLPVNPDQFFKPGEFEEWIRICSESQKIIDLTFTEGIDWQAFFQSIQRVCQEYPDANVGLQSIEEKESAFITRLVIMQDADPVGIESLILREYDTILHDRETQGEIKVLRKMSDVLEQLVDQTSVQYDSAKKLEKANPIMSFLSWFQYSQAIIAIIVCTIGAVILAAYGDAEKGRENKRAAIARSGYCTPSIIPSVRKFPTSIGLGKVSN